MKDDGGTVMGDILGKMLELTGGVDLVRKRPLTHPSPDELEARYLKGQGEHAMAQPQDTLDHVVEAVESQVTSAQTVNHLDVTTLIAILEALKNLSLPAACPVATSKAVAHKNQAFAKQVRALVQGDKIPPTVTFT